MIDLGANSPSRPAPELVPQVRAVCERLIPVAREAARACGYALAVHGSLARDLDLIAVPWTDEAIDEASLPKVIADALSAMGEGDWYWGSPNKKPHNRMAWTLHGGHDAVVFSEAGAHPFIDLSVLPRAA